MSCNGKAAGAVSKLIGGRRRGFLTVSAGHWHGHGLVAGEEVDVSGELVLS